MRDLLLGHVPCYHLPPHSQNITGQASGVLVGGNLCTFTPNLGTQADATMGQDIILFIEEVGESMHNIEGEQYDVNAITVMVVQTPLVDRMRMAGKIQQGRAQSLDKIIRGI
ncbi:MAG: hypothetical protein K5842_06685 [Bacteroidales bacterium]|nr:hypothetical protein [Bacteroidales bacterium]